LRLSSIVLAALVAAGPVWSFAAGIVQAPYGPWGVDESGMDRSVRPGDDFFAYVNGAWDRRTTIDAQRSSAGIDVDLVEAADRDVRAIALGLAAKADATSAERKIADLYGAWMDEAAIEARGTAPLAPYLAQIEAVKTTGELTRLFAEIGFESPVDIDIQPDLDDPTRYVVALDQAGLSMPREYYLNAGAPYDAYRKAYLAHVATMLRLAGIREPQAKAQAIVDLETRLAKAHWAPERARDVEQTNNPMDMAKLETLAPGFNWPGMFAVLGLGVPAKILVSEPSEVSDANAELTATPLGVWKAWLAFHFIDAHASALPKAFDEASFDFYGRTLRGTPAQRDRWKRGVALLDGVLGEEVGRVYVAQHFGPEAERQADELVDDLRAAYAERFARAAWMDEATRKAALAKLAAFEPRLGHPAKYIDYASLKIDRRDLFGDEMRAARFEWRLQLSRYPKPVDRGLWDMTPQEVNAYYNPLTNQITFPAAILQAPYFDPAADPAVNYGGEGATIGHEMGHGFDDQGRHFGPTGRLTDWWTPDTAKAFEARAAVLAAQFDTYEAFPGAHVNGALTLGENIGDLAGLEAAYGAWRRYVARHGEPPVVDGFTGDQRFFIGYAQSWRSKSREAALREQLASDPHSPEPLRVNGIVRNVDAWYAAFEIQPGDKLYLPPDQRAHIW
jgi:endothelin-converting enzyme/putative endopeptidase